LRWVNRSALNIEKLFIHAPQKLPLIGRHDPKGGS
jgi:hypothetical protein